MKLELMFLLVCAHVDVASPPAHQLFCSCLRCLLRRHRFRVLLRFQLRCLGGLLGGLLGGFCVVSSGHTRLLSHLCLHLHFLRFLLGLLVSYCLLLLAELDLRLRQLLSIACTCSAPMLPFTKAR